MLYLLLLSLLTSHPAAATSAAALPPLTPLDPPVPPLAPVHPRTEHEAARVESAAYYAAGRVLLARGDAAGALRRFQRAWRYHPEAVSILPEIVFLAHRLHRPDETARYALVAAQHTELRYPLLLRLAAWLKERRDWAGAIQMYEKARQAREAAARRGETQDVGAVILDLELGSLHLLVQDYEQAARYLSRVREALDHPDRLSKNKSVRNLLLGQADRTYRLLAESFFRAGRYEDAEAMFQKANEAQRNDGLLAYHRARIADKRGKPQDALRLLSRYFDAKLDVMGSAPYALLAELLRKTAKDDKHADEQLLARLQALHEKDPENPSLAYYLAGVYREHERWDQAEQLLRPLAEEKPGADVYAALIEVYHRQQQYDRLLEILADGVVLAGSLEAIGKPAEKLASDRQATARLIAAARRRLDQRGDALKAGIPLAAAWLAFRAERYDEAASLFDAAMGLVKPDAREQILLTWGLELLLAKQYERAVGVFERAVRKEEPGQRDDVCRLYLVRALALSGKIDEALRAAEEAATKHPDSARIQAQPGWVLYYAKRYREAEKRYLALLDQFDGRHDSSMIRDQMRNARLILSNLCVQLDRTAEAEEWLEQVLDEFPEDIGALNDLGYLWTEQGKRLNWALRMIRQAVEGDPDNPAYLDSLGWVYYQLGRYEQAVKELEKAVSSAEQPDGVILDHLGDAYIKVNQRESALRTWRRAAESFRKNQDDVRRKATLAKIKRYEK